MNIIIIYDKIFGGNFTVHNFILTANCIWEISSPVASQEITNVLNLLSVVMKNVILVHRHAV